MMPRLVLSTKTGALSHRVMHNAHTYVSVFYVVAESGAIRRVEAQEPLP
jgi:hypothetical protein